MFISRRGSHVLLLLLKVSVEISGDGGVLLVDVHLPGPTLNLLLMAESRASRHGRRLPLWNALTLKRPPNPPFAPPSPNPPVPGMLIAEEPCAAAVGGAAC